MSRNATAARRGTRSPLPRAPRRVRGPVLAGLPVLALLLAPCAALAETPIRGTLDADGLATPGAEGLATVASTEPGAGLDGAARDAAAVPATRPPLAPDAAAAPSVRIKPPQKLTALDLPLPKSAKKAERIRQICGLIEREARRVGMPPSFFARVINKESRFDPYAVSPVGAQGVAQFMPYTAKERGLANPFEVTQAIPASADYLRDLHAEFGNWGLAAAAYNAGPRRVNQFFEGRILPYETRDYVLSVALRPATFFKVPGAKIEVTPLDPKKPFYDACLELPTKRISRPKVPGQIVEVPWQPWGVQLAASFVRQSAVESFQRQAKRYRKVIGGRQPLVIKSRVPGMRRSKYAARVGAPTRRAAEKLCARIRSAGGACLVAKNTR